MIGQMMGPYEVLSKLGEASPRRSRSPDAIRARGEGTRRVLLASKLAPAPFGFYTATRGRASSAWLD